LDESVAIYAPVGLKRLGENRPRWSAEQISFPASMPDAPQKILRYLAPLDRGDGCGRVQRFENFIQLLQCRFVDPIGLIDDQRVRPLDLRTHRLHHGENLDEICRVDDTQISPYPKPILELGKGEEGFDVPHLRHARGLDQHEIGRTSARIVSWALTNCPWVQTQKRLPVLIRIFHTLRPDPCAIDAQGAELVDHERDLPAPDALQRQQNGSAGWFSRLPDSREKHHRDRFYIRSLIHSLIIATSGTRRVDLI
jgi:hypothetical protein